MSSFSHFSCVLYYNFRRVAPLICLLSIVIFLHYATFLKSILINFDLTSLILTCVLFHLIPLSHLHLCSDTQRGDGTDS